VVWYDVDMKNMITIVENETSVATYDLHDMIVSRCAGYGWTREHVASALRSIFPCCYVHVGGHHVAVCPHNGSQKRDVLVIGRSEDFR